MYWLLFFLSDEFLFFKLIFLYLNVVVVDFKSQKNVKCLYKYYK